MHRSDFFLKTLFVFSTIIIVGCLSQDSPSTGEPSQKKSDSPVNAASENDDPQVSEDQQQQAADLEASFIETFLRLRFAKSISNNVPLVLEQELSIELIAKEEKNTVDLIQRAQRKDQRLAEAVNDLLSKRQGTNTVETIGRPTIEHVILTDKQMEDLFNTKDKDGWAEFYKSYPSSPGIITLSRPGFSKDGTLAVIYMGNRTHWLAGHGKIYVLEKKNGKWVDAQMVIGPSWVS